MANYEEEAAAALIIVWNLNCDHLRKQYVRQAIDGIRSHLRSPSYRQEVLEELRGVVTTIIGQNHADQKNIF